MNRRSFLASLGLLSISGKTLLADMIGIDPSLSIQPSPAFGSFLEFKKLTFVGDLQRTSVAEQVLLARPQNDREREAVIKSITDLRPDALFFLGDQVSNGDDTLDWDYYDRVTKGLRDMKVPMFSVMGNHDYGQNVRKCLDQTWKRFPGQGGEKWGVRRIGSLAIIGLDSNFDHLSESEIRSQKKWFKEILSEMDSDPLVRATLVMIHHPPYSNSELGGNDQVISNFVDSFENSKKTRLMLSGHVHSYERFSGKTQGKMYVVSGGGGGPRRTVSIGSTRPFKNDLYRNGTFRPFNYLVMESKGDKVEVRTMMLQKKGFVVGDRFTFTLEPPITLASEK